VTCFTFNRNDTVEARPLRLTMQSLFDLEDNLVLFFTGYSRSAGSILMDQKVRSEHADEEMLANLHHVKDLGERSCRALEAGQLGDFGALMDEHWQHKKRRSGAMSNPQIDEWYELGRVNGAVGGKLVGAGGGGFLLFYAEEHRRLRAAMARAGLEEVRFRFDFEGTKVLFG
jgi:D-glycero-alpha-D-manno-heptose-7-phosphate kinase